MTASAPAPETRDRILDAAEALFGEHGIEATSMRMIARTAQANLAAANYHFGSKEALIREVFRRRLVELNRRRLQALDALEAEAAGGVLKPSCIVDAFFGTALDVAADTASGGDRFMRLLGRTSVEPHVFVRSFLAEEHVEGVDRFISAFRRALPDVPREEILWRFHFMLGATSYSIAGTDSLRLFAGSFDDADPVRLRARLMAFMLGGMRAPLPEFAGDCGERSLQ